LPSFLLLFSCLFHLFHLAGRVKTSTSPA
jgi:hypothetical protein